MTDNEQLYETYMPLDAFLMSGSEDASAAKKRRLSFPPFDIEAFTDGVFADDDAICPAADVFPSPTREASVEPESLCASVCSTAPPSPSPTPHAEGGACCNARRANGHACGKTRSDFRTDAEWEKYRNRRQRNNEAALRSRQRKRERQTAAADYTTQLTSENARLKLRVEVLEEQVQYMRTLLMQLAATVPDKASILAKLNMPSTA